MCSMCAKTHITAKGGARSWWEFWCLRAHREGLKKPRWRSLGPRGGAKGKRARGTKGGEECAGCARTKPPALRPPPLFRITDHTQRYHSAKYDGYEGKKVRVKC